MTKLMFVGALNYGKIPVCGETAKNQMLLNFFMKKYPDTIFFDTLKWRSSPSLLLKILFSLIFTRNRGLILSVSSDSGYKFSRTLFYFPKKFRLFYFVVGGNFANRMLKGEYNPKYYKQYDKIFVQGRQMVTQLHDMGLDNNVEYLPNCRTFDISLLSEEICRNPNEKLRFVFLSRITEDKGVSMLLDAVRKLNQEKLDSLFDLTFYGPIADEYRVFFDKMISVLPNVKYQGILNLQSDKGYKVLSGYDMMIFPTHWHGEGFPGVVVDAFIAGLPILASDWNLNREVIDDNVTGYLFGARDMEQLCHKMRHVIQKSEVLIPMRRHCLEKAKLFHSDTVLGRLSL